MPSPRTKRASPLPILLARLAARFRSILGRTLPGRRDVPVDRNAFGGPARQLEARLTDYQVPCRRVGEDHPAVVDCMADIRAPCARIDRLWGEGAEDAGDDEGG